MDYLFENLGDERFQELCSSIISAQFPNTQSYPVGQPDGGRDTVAYIVDNSPSKKFIVFQVKYVRDGNKDRDLPAWITNTLKKEAEKYLELSSRGAIGYYLLTNVRGTAHLDNGSKDIVNNILETHLSIPAICWWRDDLSRLLEKDINIKWSFPEILNGQDVLNSLLFEQFNENREKRSAAIRAYLTDQYEIESEVKFKQIDLQNKLLSLFTDVPLRIKKIGEKNKRLRKTVGEIFKQTISDESHPYRSDEIHAVGAAEFILNATTQQHVTKMLLEGGPGQGKSTITQYACQVHRIKLLGNKTDLALLPSHIANTPVRVPLKVDLRDVASWLERKNPYENILPTEYFEKNWTNSLESYLLGHIYFHSKIELNINDILAIFRNSPVIFVFDGFDEIANIELRRGVIEFVNKGIARLSANSKSIQVVITSRPAAFSDAIVFSVDDYPHFELTDISTKIINEYLEKWIKASKLDSRDANELRRLVKDKLQLPHLKDLAKTPMQLAIFISLLRTKGQSLPNKRTALFDSYVSLYFDRESEKSVLIRDKRDLIIEIHQYLAWVLHSEAERFKNSGRISLPHLQQKLRNYLSELGHDPSITEQLFDVMKERVCALVSRVQGTFEFEVQPLREYFCAKHLYTSAPNSTAGNVRRGTKPDRFKAILKNPYWQNVVRFFAGCADAGELDMIIQELKELQEDEQYKNTHYPRILTSQILSDYVFTQKPKKMNDVVKIIIDGINIGSILNETDHTANSERIMLPDECGRPEVVAECFRQLARLPSHDYASELIGIIKNNPLNNLDRWLKILPQFSDEKDVSTWLEYGYRLGIAHRIDGELLKSLLDIASGQDFDRRLRIVLEARRESVFSKNPELKSRAVNSIAMNRQGLIPRGKSISSLGFLALVINPVILTLAHQAPNGSESFIQYLSELITGGSVLDLEFPVDDEIDERLAAYKAGIYDFLSSSTVDLQHSLIHWIILERQSINLFGETWTVKIMSVIAAGVKVRSDEERHFFAIDDIATALCMRARSGRLRSGNINYWRQILENSADSKFSLLLFFVWATPRAICELIPVATNLVGTLEEKDRDELIDGLAACSELSTFSEPQQRQLVDAIHTYSELKGIDIIAYFLSLRFKARDGEKFINSYFTDLSEAPIYVAQSQFSYLIRTFLRDPTSEKLLSQIKSLYARKISYNERYYYMAYVSRSKIMPIEMAMKVMLHCKEYPRAVASIAEMACRAAANANLVPIGEIAEKDEWFADI